MRGFLYFLAGAIFGAVYAGFALRKYYQNIADEEIESVKSVYKKRDLELEERIEQEQKKIEYAARLNGCGYSDVKEAPSRPQIPMIDNDSIEVPASDRPYVISPEEFGEFDDYANVTLTYYKGDSILTDENDDEIEDIDGAIGEESLNHFGEYEDDVVYVRNDSRRCDYEVLLDRRTYSDVVVNPGEEDE